MKIILWILLILGGSLILITLIGALLPKEHTATREARYHQKPEAIWAAITEIDAMPSWRDGLKSVKHLPDHNGLPAYIEVTSMGEIPLETDELLAPQKLVRRIAGANLPFGGTWTYEITPTAEGSVLRITERGWVSNPLFRFLSRFIFSYSGEIERYLRALARKFGEQPQIGA